MPVAGSSGWPARATVGGWVAASRGVVLAVALAGLSACAAPVQAAQTYPGPPSIEDLARRADVVVVGEVTAAAGEWDAARTSIRTRVHLDAREVLKGAVASPLSFTRLGGQVGDQVSMVGGAAQFAPGERVVVFLARQPDGGLRLADLMHGKLTLERDPATGQEIAVRFTGAPGADRFGLDQVRADVRRASGG